MPEPRWRDVAANGECSHCGGTHYGTGSECPYREENMGEPCVQCGDRTSYCCADCRLDGAGSVYVCIKDSCRTEHEKKHVKPARTSLDLDARAFALFRAWADKLPTAEEARAHWDNELSMADHGEWRRRVLAYEQIVQTSDL
jgi:hypothetical protein